MSFEIVETVSEIVRKKKEKKTSEKTPKTKAQTFLISGNEYIARKLNELENKVHKEIRPLINMSESIVAYKEEAGKAFIKYEDKSSLEIQFGDKKHRYIYKSNGKVVFDEKA